MKPPREVQIAVLVLFGGLLCIFLGWKFRPRSLLQRGAGEWLRYQPWVIETPILLPHECDAVVACALPKLQRSTVHDGKTSKVDHVRTSHQAWLSLSETDPTVQTAIQKLYANASKWTGVYDPELFEQIQVVRYESTQEYRPHYDACVKHCAKDTQIFRRATLLVYLTDDFDGGETYFPRLDLRVRQPKGYGLLFFNVDQDTGEELDMSEHGGLPVLRGVKWVCNVWIRYNPSVRTAHAL